MKNCDAICNYIEVLSSYYDVWGVDLFTCCCI
jgi:hypothetical protein